MEGAEELNNFINVWTTVFASLTYCYFIASKIPTGMMRLLSLLPILLIFILLPLKIESVHFGVITSGFVTWLCSFKLVLFAIDQGPLSLSSHPSMSLLHFICLASFPVQTKQKCDAATKGGPKSILNYTTKALLCALIVKIVEYRQFMNQFLLFALYFCHLYMLLELVLAIFAVPVRTILGFEIEPQFNDPYLSTSLQDFWGRRWDIMVTNILRPTVYQPMMRISKPLLGKNSAQIISLLTTFLVSGLMHELIVFDLTRVRPTWVVTGFFVLQGVATILEILVKRMVRDKLQIHPTVARSLTLGFVVVSAYWGFFDLVMQHEVDNRMIREYTVLAKYIKVALLWPLS